MEEQAVKCGIVVDKETKDTCPQDAILFVRPSSDVEEQYCFNICEKHEKLLREGKAFIAQDSVSNNYFAFQYNLNPDPSTDTIKESQDEPPLRQEDS